MMLQPAAAAQTIGLILGYDWLQVHLKTHEEMAQPVKGVPGPFRHNGCLLSLLKNVVMFCHFSASLLSCSWPCDKCG
jgi:hypothetical protein